MKLREKYEKWVNTLTPYDEKKVIIWLAQAGLGDKLSNLPAFRHLKTMYPDKKIVLYTEPLVFDLWKSCRYIDVAIPEGYIRGEGALNIMKEDLGIRAFWSFYEHHQKHIVASSVEYICNTEYTPDIPLEYELDIFDYDIPEIAKHQEHLVDLAQGKPIAAIAPAYTMYSRMWDVTQWEKLTNLLKQQGYFVVALGGNNDLEPKNVDLNMCGKYPIRQVPHILDVFETVFTLNSGMLHLASVNQTIPMVYISVGQFPPEIIAPYRNGEIGGGPDKMLFVDHDCPLKDQCFREHIEETGINRQGRAFLERWKKEEREDFQDDGLLQKYICWWYCAKVMGKYSCGENLTPNKVMKAFLNWRKDD